MRYMKLRFRDKGKLLYTHLVSEGVMETYTLAQVRNQMRQLKATKVEIKMDEGNKDGAKLVRNKDLSRVGRYGIGS